ncbi:unknown [Cryptophlebia leucotreta granulovirus]|uniref:Uncharacterized protein n=1 Tax=Cryptophlebia leucotreta granulosis virus TaxID=35254 RepID=Q7T5H9_GVCL|nr:hypothetical protein [Cryptophlebia leucotreta granulovirus]AAQ21709.1 unknown [Cryptophlebia leucotreta granulovirus]AUF82067.1 hypothetical protein [Cryptophlebia leucotreta granulovirus]
MILFTKEHFEQRKVSIIMDSNIQIYFKLVEVLRILFKMCDHTYIDESYIKIFNEFPNTKYVSAAGLQKLITLSPRKDVGCKLEMWADEVFLKLINMY